MFTKFVFSKKKENRIVTFNYIIYSYLYIYIIYIYILYFVFIRINLKFLRVVK